MTLRDLYEKATGGEWFDIPHPKYKSACHRITNRADQPWESFGQIAYVGKKNAALIVALHNCLPELLKVVEAAEDIRDQHQHGPSMCGGERMKLKCYCPLCAALADLREKEGKL